MKYLGPWLSFAITASVAGFVNAGEQADLLATKDERPNILLIVADDLGYTDLGSFGSEISTPNLDALAQSGVRLSNFHVAATCSPTRSMLLSGTDNHLAGLGSMLMTMKGITPSLLGKPGYEGYLNDKVAPLPQLLKDAGYRTYMTGKWHLGMSLEHSPMARGFDKSFVLLEGGSGHFSDLGLAAQAPHSSYREDGELVNLPDDFYSTRFYAERMIQYLTGNESERESHKPFFGYLAYTAPHWPLQAPDESIQRQKGRYKDGYRSVFRQRLLRQQTLGLIPAGFDIESAVNALPEWDSLTAEEQRIAERRMEIYAAMIDDLDRYTGKVIAALKAAGLYENTFIIFMSDNGAQSAGMSVMYDWAETCCDNSYENMGKANSYLFPEKEWARVSTGISKGFKAQVTQGGIRAPAFIHYPKSRAIGAHYDQFLSVMDVVPTVLELAGVHHPGDHYHGREVYPVKGSSFASLVLDESIAIHPEDYVMGWEFFGGKAVRQGNWKLVFDAKPKGDGEWRLYNLETDPAESNDLSQQEQERLQQMQRLWKAYVKENGVLPLPFTARALQEFLAFIEWVKS